MTSIEKARLAKAQKDIKYIQDNQSYALTISTALSRLMDLDFINKRCVLEFILGKMDQTNSQRFRSLCNDQTDPDEQCKPDLLWISIIDHLQCENNAVIYLYQTKLDQLEQDHNTTRTDHINNFMKIKTEIKNVPLDSVPVGTRVPGCLLRKNGTNTAPDTTWRVLAVLLAGTGGIFGFFSRKINLRCMASLFPITPSSLS
ncbi:hypothetical protein PSTT_15992 [Puccinia striiformis]|uniref:Uncharacterized protein n=1 Tax=Puccinia striiformis TaxID=27350 RepID=A0A2S4UF57_9BASI|nr:hypothetical protein PSTT_15992 [Puccinia striiformis]